MERAEGRCVDTEIEVVRKGHSRNSFLENFTFLNHRLLQRPEALHLLVTNLLPPVVARGSTVVMGCMASNGEHARVRRRRSSAFYKLLSSATFFSPSPTARHLREDVVKCVLVLKGNACACISTSAWAYQLWKVIVGPRLLVVAKLIWEGM